jgi:replicative DNA helicase
LNADTGLEESPCDRIKAEDSLAAMATARKSRNRTRWAALLPPQLTEESEASPRTDKLYRPHAPGKPLYKPRVDAVPTNEQGQPEEWPEPEPLGTLASAMPPWPWEVYPRPLRDIGREIAETMNVPDELPGLATLCATSMAARKVAVAEIKHGHRQYPNLYGIAALPPATGKSPALRPIQAPLIAAQIDARAEHRNTLLEWKGRAKFARARIRALEKQAERGEGTPDEIAAEIARLESVAAECPAEPILIADNATSEALARILAGNGGTLGIMSADARDILAIAGGKYSRDSSDISIWLKAHAGDYLAYHRSNPEKPPFECAEPILAALLAVQPDALLVLGQSPALRDSGFLARWLYVIPQCTPGDYPEGSITHAAQRDYTNTLRALLAMDADTDAEGKTCAHICRLDEAAFTAWKQFHDSTKREAHTAGPLMAQSLGKLPEHAARIALVFHLAECAARGAHKPGPIDTEILERAIVLSLVLKQHLARAVELLGESGERAKARELLPIIWKYRDTLREYRQSEGLGDLCAVKPRDIVRGTWAGIQSTEEARAALKVLDIKGWVGLRTVNLHGTREHELYELHPYAVIPQK